jgi:putative endonuclease
MHGKAQRLGEMGESLAAEYLQRAGYEILDRNWHCLRGELDIVAKRADEWIFVEVKTRRGQSIESALLSFTPSKRERLIASVYHYFAERQLEDALWRIDVIGIALPRDGAAIIEHVENALDW